MTEDQEHPAIACSLAQSDLADRRDRWLRLAEQASVVVLTTDSGLRMRFRQGPTVEAEIRQLAALERECCAFAEWSVHAHADQVVLDVTADSEEGIAAVQSMFLPLRPDTSETAAFGDRSWGQVRGASGPVKAPQEAGEPTTKTA